MVGAPALAWSGARVRLAQRRLAALLAVVMAVMGLVNPAPAQAGTSSGNAFSVTKTASVATVPAGGGNVTYTYTVKNLTSSPIFYISGTDDKCGRVTEASGVQHAYDWLVAKTFDLVPANGTATWTCTQKVTQTTTNTASFTFATGYTRGLFSYSYTGSQTATDQATVTVQQPVNLSAGTCNTLWYSGDEQTMDSFGRISSLGVDGTIGTIDPATGTIKPVMSIGQQTNSSVWVGSAAVAISPANPNLVYYIPRETITVNSPGGALWVYDQSTGTSHVVAQNVNTTTANIVVRLGADPQGNLWSITDDGTLYKLDPTATNPTWTNAGKITLSDGKSLANLASGDLAFDGNGTMYFIASDSGGTSYLYTLSAAQLTAAASGTPQTATYVGKMTPGTGDFFNGFAFGPDGQAYASTTNPNNSPRTTSLYKVDITNGSVTLVKKQDVTSSAYVSDLTSCALPKPELRVTKTVNPAGAVNPGDTLTYTIKIENLGTLAATNVTFSDIPSGSTVTSETLNGGANLGATYYNTAKQVNSPGATAGIVAPGGTATIVITTTVPTTTSSTQACNQASVNLTGVSATLLSDDPTLSGATDKTCVPIKNPKIAIDKTASTTTLNSDGTPTAVTYTYTVTNTGTEPLKTVSVSDDKCSPVSYTSGDTNGDAILTGDETWTYTCTQTLTTTTTNIATATGTGASSNKAVNATDTWTVTAPPMTFSKTVSPTGTVKPGDTLTYTLTAKNTSSSDLTNVTVTDPLPAGVTYVSGSSTMTYTNAVSAHSETQTVTSTQTVNIDSTTKSMETITLPASMFPAGAQATGYSVTMDGQAFVTSGHCGGTRDVGVTGTFSGAVSMATTTWVTPGTTAGTGSFSNDPTNATTSCSGAWKTVTKTGTLSGALTSDVVLTLGWWDQWPDATVTPDNQATSVKVAITYNVPASTQTVNKAAHDPANLVTTADAVTLHPGETLTVTFKVTVDADAPATITNLATGDSDQTPPVDDSVDTQVDRPQLDLAKQPGTVTGPDANGNYTATYKVTVTNTGSSTVTYGPITDTPKYDADLTPVSASWSGQATGNTTFSAAPYSFTMGGASTSIAPKETQTYDVQVVFKRTGTGSVATCGGAGTGLFNQVSLPTGQETGPSDNNTACMMPPAAFSVQKAANGGLAGGTGSQVTAVYDAKTGSYTATATYLVTVTNTGLVAATAPVVTDTPAMPAGLTLSSITLDGNTVTLTNGSFTIAAGPSLEAGATAVHTVVVVATGTPDLTQWAAIGSCDTAAAGTAGTGLFNQVAMTGDSDGADNNDACVPVVAPTKAFSLLKQALDSGASLTGAQFALYTSDPTVAGATPVQDGITVDSTNTARFTSSQLVYGTYWLVETKAPTGYNLMAQPIKVTLTDTGVTPASSDQMVKQLSSDAFTLVVSDADQAQLPKTGGAGAGHLGGLELAALCLLVCAAGLVARRRMG